MFTSGAQNTYKHQQDWCFRATLFLCVLNQHETQRSGDDFQIEIVKIQATETSTNVLKKYKNFGNSDTLFRIAI